MGEVYKARDTRLDRTVAVKVLPEYVAAEPALTQRFVREAKTLAALSHPHICPVFDVGRQDGIEFLVMEYLEGDTLAQRLAKGALPIAQALAIAIQIADALDKAHRAGIVHRDLKPGNIILTKAGAKLLDFGLAKTHRGVISGADASMLPTASHRLELGVRAQAVTFKLARKRRVQTLFARSAMIDRRVFISSLSAAMLTASERAFPQAIAATPIKRVRTPTLDIAYEDHGPPTGFPVLLMHGFPYDPRAYDEVVPPVAAAGYRTIVPYIRGYGLTRFLSSRTPRSGQQAAFGRDLLELMDALQLPRAVLAGYDWGGRAACVVAALWPERVRGLVSATGYNIQDIAASRMPAAPEQEHRLWYQYYFHSERGRAGLQANRRELCRLLWRLWSPNWTFDDATYERTAASFDNPDFVELVIHSYRHRFGYAPGDPELEPLERLLAAQPRITVPTIVLHGGGDGVNLAASSATHARFFTGPYQRRVLPSIGHNVPQEAPAEVAAALLELLS